MAEGKKSFLIYCDIIYQIDHLTDEEKGRLFQHLLEYVNDKEPTLEDRVLLSVWKPIERQLKRDLKKYEERCNKNKQNVLKRWNKKDTNVYDGIRMNTKHTDNDIDNDIDKDIDNNIKELFNKFVDEVKNHFHDSWIELMYKNFKLKPGSLTELSIKFKEHLLIKQEDKKDIKDFKDHFYNWLLTQQKLDKLKLYERKT